LRRGRHDGSISNVDLQGLLTYLKNGNGSLAAVPEPPAVFLAGLGLFGLGTLCIRRRAALHSLATAANDMRVSGTIR